MKEEGNRQFHSRGGKTPFYTLQQSQANARTRVPPDRKKREVTKNRKRTKIKESLPLSANPLGLGITRGTYDAERGLLTNATAALSADISASMLDPTV